MYPSLPEFVKPATILNVDDHDGCRYVTTRVLREARFLVDEAATGSEALRMVRDLRPDLVLLDIHLPDINGIEVCRRIKADPDTARIPVLHITATATRGRDRSRGLDAGAESYLIEPVEPEVLVATVNAALRTRQAEASLARLAREWQATFDAMNEGIAVLDAEGHVLRCNRAMGALWNRDAAQLLGLTPRQLWEGHPAAREGLAFERMLHSKRREQMEAAIGGRWLEVTSDPLLDPEGRITGAVYVVADFTARHRMEQKIRRAQKLESIGLLAGGVAHDFNNLLTSILGNASLALSDTPGDSGLREKLSEILRAGERAADLTRQLLAYSGHGRFVVRKLNPRDLLRECEPALRGLVPAGIALEVSVDPATPWVEADPRQLQQALSNLVGNAAEAIEGAAGRISIRAGAVRRDEDPLRELPAGEYACIEVRDTGCGIDEATRPRIFDPFFSTKFVGRGLGLSAVEGIVRAHRGAIEVDSAPGAGSVFAIYLPAVEAPPAAALADPGLAAAETVLVVDDEEMIRRMAATALEKAGWQVLTAADGIQAVELVRRHGPRIALILLDLTMPRLDGAETLREIDKIRPGIRVIVSTGYSQREVFQRFSRNRVLAFVQKPYTPSQLAARVKAALEPH